MSKTEKATPLALAIALKVWPNGQPNVHYGYTDEDGVWSIELNEQAKQNSRNWLAVEIDTVLKPEFDALTAVAEVARKLSDLLPSTDSPLAGIGDDLKDALETLKSIRSKL